MCGISGFFNTQCSIEDMNRVITGMTDAIQHRGPDDHGAWVDPDAGIALGFRRLAILDLSPLGHQPMQSVNERFVMVFNGEIYNFAGIRDELSSLGHSFRGGSDTEVMLAAVVEWGVLNAVRRFNGMFAIALWDRQERVLHLTRDRMGIKPLYYGWAGREFLFGSELKSLVSHAAFQPEIDRDSLASYLRNSYIASPRSIYKNIHKILPGTILSLKFSTPQPVESLETYWSAHETVEQGIQNPFDGNTQDAIFELDRLLCESVKQRMVADVPLGAFLSGGIDSSLIVAMMQMNSPRPVKTFSIGFHERLYNEAPHAKAVARHLGTEHVELYVSSQDALNVIPLLPTLYDEPLADVSQIPTYLVSKLAREHVTVSLSGDGGDELFGGYSRYQRTQKMWTSMRWMPYGLRRMMSRISSKIAALPLQGKLATKFFFLSEILSAEDLEKLYVRLMSQWEDPQQLVINGKEPSTLLTNSEKLPANLKPVEKMMYTDLMTYLPDDIFAKLDRASMGVSLEARAPFIDDHRVVEFAWSLPLEMKLRAGQGKWILRQILNRYVPRELTDRPKMGFGVPIDTWLRGPLREWAEELLDEKRMTDEGYLNPHLIQKRWQEHRKNQKNWQYPLWNVLMFQAWLEKTKASTTSVNG
jgi:asparagine synthase (glutamine-hydrolysing)